MRKRTTRCNSDSIKQEPNSSIELDNDISLLQRPLRTAHTGFEEARRAYVDGTNEVRRLLTQECSLIYECNVCRNMFRSLANFISHKRVFCCSSASTSSHNGYTDQDSTMIMQPPIGSGPSPQDIENMLRSRSTGCSPVQREPRPMRGSIRDLSGVIERLRREKASTHVSSDHAVLQLEAVPSTSHAVYQTVKLEPADSMKTEVNEVHHMLNQADTIVGPDGKAMTSQEYDRQGGGGSSESGENLELSLGDDSETNILCELCNLTFQTNKTLEVHIQKHHSSSSYVFQCPACSLTFLQAAAVIRHLSKDHKKPTRRIRMMRPSILKRRVQQGDVQPKGPSRELKRLQLSDNPVAGVLEAASTSSEQRKIMSLCIYCEKSFERRAALSTHLLNCRAKQEALAKPAPPVKKLKSKANGSNASSIDADDSGNNLPDLASIERSLLQAKVAFNEMITDMTGQDENYSGGLKTVSLDKVDLQESDMDSELESNSVEEQDHEQDHDQSSAEETKANESVTAEAPKSKKKRNVPLEKQLRCRCKICQKQFNTLGNLRRHISMFHYRARRFGCNMCDYRAFRRYDIVNHLGFTHRIEGNREQLTEKYVTTYECKYSRDDVDADIILLGQETDQPSETADGHVGSETKVTKTYEKRQKRLKTSETATSTLNMELKEEIVEPTPPKKRRKSRSQVSPESGEHLAKTTGNEKRPIRKRVKPVNKDFVYDHVTFKPGATATAVSAQPASAVDSMRSRLRRQNSNAIANDESKVKPNDLYITQTKKSQVIGITQRIMQELVNKGRAVSATLPELPAERPQIRPRLISLQRSESDQNFVETSASTSESFIEKIAKRTAAASKDSATITNLWQKVNTVVAQQKLETNNATYQSPDFKTPNGKHNAEKQQSPPTTPRKNSSLSMQAAAIETPPTSTSISKPPTTAIECLSSEPAAQTNSFPALPMPPSVFSTTGNGTVQFTLDSLLRAALQN